MRKILVLLLTTFAVMGVHAWEPTTADIQLEVALVPPSYAEALVTIAPVPMPAMVIELANYAPKVAGLRQAKKATAAKVAHAKSMLSRSAREQVALASASAKPDDRARLTASDDEDADTGIDELDLHRSFSQPKVVKVSDQTDDGEEAIDLPNHIKVRLLMARTKAVEAHVLNLVGRAADFADDELSDTVKLRLSVARARALKAHSEKFGVT